MGMNSIKAIRMKLEMTQGDLARHIGCTQANVGHYEKGQTVPPGMARKIIDAAKKQGVQVSFDDIYANELTKVHANQPQPATQSVAQGI